MTFESIIQAISKKPYYQDDAVVIYHADNRDILPLIPDKGVDLVLTDPPYGIGLDTEYGKFMNSKSYQEVVGDAIGFDPSQLLKLDTDLIVWGANNFASKLPDYGGWLAWFKTRRNDTHIRQAEMELAWTNCIKRSQAYRYTWIGAYRESGEDIGYCHPCQKPLSLMKWTLNLMPDAKVILDPYMGVGSSIMAGKLLGRKCIGIEIEEKYCEIAAKRCSQSVMSLNTELVKVEEQEPFIYWDSLPPNP